MNLQTKNPLPSTLVLFSYHSYHFVMWLWFFTGAQKVQLSQGANGKTLCSLVLIISFLPRTRLPALARRDPFLLHWHQQPECHSFVTVWSLGAEFSAPNADWGWVFCRFFFCSQIHNKASKNGGSAHRISSTHTCLMEVNNPADFKRMTNVHEVQHKCNWLQARGLDADPRIWLQQQNLMQLVLISLILILVKGVWHRTCLLKGLKYMCILFKKRWISGQPP